MDSGNRVQDAYSIRCTPQVLGPVYETLEFIRPQIEREINAATDNPLIFEDDSSLSGGNFHGEIIGLAMDYCGIALSEMGAIAERRIYRLLDSSSNAGLPPMLVDSPEDAGLNSGYMMPHYTAAALALENQTWLTQTVCIRCLLQVVRRTIMLTRGPQPGMPVRYWIMFVRSLL